jgi:hypothetical protein
VVQVTAMAISAHSNGIDPMLTLCDNELTIDMLQGDLLGYCKVYYHPGVAATNLSFFNITKRYRSVINNNQLEDAFVVTHDDGTKMKFKPSGEGLYYFDFNESIKSWKE